MRCSGSYPRCSFANVAIFLHRHGRVRFCKCSCERASLGSAQLIREATYAELRLAVRRAWRLGSRVRSPLSALLDQASERSLAGEGFASSIGTMELPRFAVFALPLSSLLAPTFLRLFATDVFGAGEFFELRSERVSPSFSVGCRCQRARQRPERVKEPKFRSSERSRASRYLRYFSISSGSGSGSEDVTSVFRLSVPLAWPFSTPDDGSLSRPVRRDRFDMSRTSAVISDKNLRAESAL